MGRGEENSYPQSTKHCSPGQSSIGADMEHTIMAKEARCPLKGAPKGRWCLGGTCGWQCVPACYEGWSVGVGETSSCRDGLKGAEVQEGQRQAQLNFTGNHEPQKECELAGGIITDRAQDHLKPDTDWESSG